MQFVLIPFVLCFLLYIRQENQYRFRAATALKITLTMTLTLCLTVALARRFSPVLLTATVGMLLCAGGDFYLQYIRRDVKIPLVLMGYLNPIMQFGFENFCRKCVECGIDGVIIPDLPFHDYQERYRIIAERYGIKVIMLITPETSEERVREIDAHTDGFIYMVSSAATTGAQQDFNEQKRLYFKKIEDMHLKNPLMVGFGISNKATFQAACEHASGAIIGSRFVTLLEEEKDPEKAILKLKEALK